MRKLSKEYYVPSVNGQQKYIGGGGCDPREEESDLDPGLCHEEPGGKEVRSDQSEASIV